MTLDGQPATLHVGERYPLVTATYSGGSSNQIGNGLASGLIAPPTINFEDLGLVLKVTPSVHDQGEVTLDIEHGIQSAGLAGTPTAIPSISTRKYTGKVRMRMDESAIVAGLLGSTDGETHQWDFRRVQHPDHRTAAAHQQRQQE